jgi:resuscitation-promoting factor RpfA
MDDERLDEAVRSGDLDELLRVIDQCCDDRDWSSLARLEGLCERAHETGRQLWPAASHAAYRLALEAPAPFAASVLREGVGRFAPGPLPEVAAQAHTWSELAPHAPPGAAAVLAAHERVVRGEDVSGRLPDGPNVIELPPMLASWEPVYALAEYHAHETDFPAPGLPRLDACTLPEAAERAAADDGVAALLEGTRVWTQESNGHSDAVVVAGDAREAIAALGVREARIASLAAPDALAQVAWAASSGGAHGRRPGAAAGRFGAWWVAGALTDLLDEWPPDPEVLGAAIDTLHWHAWDAAEPTTGWRLQLAVEDPARGRAWAVAAVDAA